MDEHFRIGVVGAEAVAAAAELEPQALMVVDLSVVGDPYRAILIGHRLRRAVAQIDDRETTMRERHAAVRGAPQARAVRAPMAHRIPCPDHNRIADRSSRSVLNDSED